MKKIAILASGEGLNAGRLAKLFNDGNRIKVDLVLTDRENAPVLTAMPELGVETVYYPREVWSADAARIVSFLQDHDIDLVVVDGFGELIPVDILEAYHNKIVSVGSQLQFIRASESLEGAEADSAEGVFRARAWVRHTDRSDGSGTDILSENFDSVEPEEVVVRKLEAMADSVVARGVVAALKEEDDRQTAMHAASMTPPEVPGRKSVEREWADALGIGFDPVRAAGTPPPVPGSPAAMKAPVNDPLPPMPSTYLVWAVICTVLCCFIPGVVAIVFASQVSSRYYAGDYKGAERASRNTQIWIIVSFVLGVLSSTLYLPLMMITGGN